MACVPLAGYFPLVDYKWSRNGVCLLGENTVLLYAQAEGDYECQVRGEGVESAKAFRVTSKLSHSCNGF